MADYGIYEKMEQVYDECRAKIVVNSAFNLGKKKFLIKSSQQDPDTPAAIALNRQATSLCQLSEHGMRTIQAQFLRLTDQLW